jgi:hypothetical protein
MTSNKGRRMGYYRGNRRAVRIAHLKRSECPSNKVPYPSEAAAFRGLRRVQQNPFEGRDKVPTRYYRCNMCHEWHLTSTELRVEGGGNHH